MTEKLKVSLWQDGRHLAEFPVRVDIPSDIERGLHDALEQFRATHSDLVIGKDGVTLSIEPLDAAEP